MKQTVRQDLSAALGSSSGADRLNPVSVAVADVLSDAREIFLRLGQLRDINLEVEHSGNYCVSVDRSDIRRVFAILIENAVKYSQPGQKIILGAQVNGIGIEFYVQDFGPGIAPEHYPSIFECQDSAGQPGPLESSGTGLGLAIVKHIVLNHGGTVRVESAWNYGSTFFFALPVAD